LSSRAAAGRVVAAHGRHYAVLLDDATLVHAVPRGKKSTLACGDRVHVAMTAPDQGVIEAVDPRSTLFFRSAAHRAKLLAANATQAAVVVAGEPSFSDELIARVLAAAEHEHMRAFIVLNKSDLVEPTASARERLQPFRSAGYRIVETCAGGMAPPDIAALAQALAGETTVLIGQSGMGKSTLVNALVPGAGAATREISRFLDSGRHTTTASRLHALPDGALIDCPGMQEFGLAHLSAADIQQAFVDVRPYLGRCRFRDCRHRAEPDCALRAAAAEGALPARRLELLLRILAAEAGR
jgi:ribosome biogenesis GTPase